MNKKIFGLTAFLLVFAAFFSTAAFAVDVSIDRVKVNGKALAESKTNFLQDTNNLDFVIDITAIKDLSNIHVESILTDLNTGNTVADSSGTFILKTNQSTLVALSMRLINVLKKQTDFRLLVKVVEPDGDTEEKSFGIRFTGGAAAGGRALDISIDSVEIEDKILAENENNFVALDKTGKELDLNVRMTALENIENAHVDAILSFENGNVVADATTTFDIGEGDNTVKSLELPIVSKFEQNSFKLKVKVTDAEGNTEEKSYGLTISQKKSPFVISSISLSPENGAEAGKVLVARLSFKNSGVVPLEGIVAKVSIPELGISSTKFVERLKDSDSVVREDFTLKILDNAQTGTYTLRAEIVSQFGGDSEVKELPFFVIGISEQAKQVVNEKLVINVPIVKQDIINDGTEVIYPLTLTNQGPDANKYTLLLDGANWADLRLRESNVFVVKPKESRTINIYASSKADTLGEQMFLVAIKSDDSVLRNIPFKGNVVAAKGTLASKLKNMLEVMLIGIVILLVAMGFFFGVKKYTQAKSDSSEDTHEQETYY